jgi:hypothetical protein
MRHGTYVVPKLVLGQPADVVHARLPRALLRLTLKPWLRLTIGPWSDYGLPTPTGPPLARPPTVNSGILDALRAGRVVAVGGIERYDGRTVHFTDGHAEAFDTIVMATGFRVSFPFLPGVDVSQLHLNLTHPAVPNLFFIGLVQPVGCIWRLADHQARIAALRISGRLRRPTALDPRRGPGIEVDYRTFERQLKREIASAT